METIGNIFDKASDSAMSRGYAFGSDAWYLFMKAYFVCNKI